MTTPRGGTPDLRGRRDGAEGSGQRAQGRRYRTSLLPWWASAVLDRMSPALIIGLMLVAVVVMGLMSLRAFMQGREAEVAAGVPASYAPVSYDGEISERWGHRLGALEELRYARFGRPLHVGPSGKPLIEGRGTGLVRELTELEMTFPHDRDYLMVPGTSGVAYAPGSTGYEVRWREPEKLRELPEPRAVDRVTWFKEQERRLQAAVNDVRLAMAQVAHSPRESWDRRWAESLSATVAALNEKYAAGDVDQWAAAGYAVRCNRELDFAYRDGLTQGCPSAGYRDAVAEVWTHLGDLVEGLRRLADSELLESNRAFTMRFENADIDGYQDRQLKLINAAAESARNSAQRLRVYGDAEGHYIHVTFD